MGAFGSALFGFVGFGGGGPGADFPLLPAFPSANCTLVLVLSALGGRRGGDVVFDDDGCSERNACLERFFASFGGGGGAAVLLLACAFFFGGGNGLSLTAESAICAIFVTAPPFFFKDEPCSFLNLDLAPRFSHFGGGAGGAFDFPFEGNGGGAEEYDDGDKTGDLRGTGAGFSLGLLASFEAGGGGERCAGLSDLRTFPYGLLGFGFAAEEEE